MCFLTRQPEPRNAILEIQELLIKELLTLNPHDDILCDNGHLWHHSKSCVRLVGSPELHPKLL